MIPQRMRPVTILSTCFMLFLATFSSAGWDFLRKNMIIMESSYWRGGLERRLPFGLLEIFLFSYFYAFWEKSNFWYMDHDSIVIDRCLDLVKCEILRKDDRSRKWSVVALFYEHAFRIEVYRCVWSLSWESEDVARESDIDIAWVDSCDRCYYDNLFSEVKDIEGYLSNIDLMLSLSMDIYFYSIVVIAVIFTMRWSMRGFRGWRFCLSPTDTKEFWHKKRDNWYKLVSRTHSCFMRYFMNTILCISFVFASF